jgi:hypothetical protein
MQDINKRLYTHKSITNRNQNIENKCLKFTFFKKIIQNIDSLIYFLYVCIRNLTITINYEFKEAF